MSVKRTTHYGFRCETCGEVQIFTKLAAPTLEIVAKELARCRLWCNCRNGEAIQSAIKVRCSDAEIDDYSI